MSRYGTGVAPIHNAAEDVLRSLGGAQAPTFQGASASAQGEISDHYKNMNRQNLPQLLANNTMRGFKQHSDIGLGLLGNQLGEYNNALSALSPFANMQSRIATGLMQIPFNMANEAMRMPTNLAGGALGGMWTV
jgi:hypothetical protein